MQPCASCGYQRVQPGRMCVRCGHRPPQTEKGRRLQARTSSMRSTRIQPTEARGLGSGHITSTVDWSSVAETLSHVAADAIFDAIVDANLD